MKPSTSDRIGAAHLLVLLAAGLGVIVLLVQLFKFASHPDPAPALFAVVLSAGLLSLARASEHLFPVMRYQRGTRQDKASQ